MATQEDLNAAKLKLYDQHFKQNQFGLNMNTIGQGIGAMNSLYQMWGSRQQLKLAKDQWKTQKSVMNTNMKNQIQSLNQSLLDRERTRASFEGRSQEDAQKRYEEKKFTQ